MTPCSCGHTKADHALDYVRRTSPCLRCRCRWFRVVGP